MNCETMICFILGNTSKYQCDTISFFGIFSSSYSHNGKFPSENYKLKNNKFMQCLVDFSIHRIESEKDGREACNALHDKGPSKVLRWNICILFYKLISN